MNAKDFAYWLQGYFEVKEADSNDARVTGRDGYLSGFQAKAVLEKAESVKPGTDPVEAQAQNFVMYVQGALSTLKFETPTLGFLVSTTTNLKIKLNELFVHAIDPALPGDQAVNRKAHRPDASPDGRPLC
jgi:hypothetical protein